MEVKLTVATLDDIPAIRELAQVIWNEHYPTIIGQEQVDYMLNKMYSEDKLADQLKQGHLFFMIEYDARQIGFISFSSINNKEYFIHKFYIQGNIQGKGLGQQVFKLWLKKCKPTSVL